MNIKQLERHQRSEAYLRFHIDHMRKPGKFTRLRQWLANISLANVGRSAVKGVSHV